MKTLKMILITGLIAIFCFGLANAQYNYSADPLSQWNQFIDTTFNIGLLTSTTGNLIGSVSLNTGAPIHYYSGIQLMQINGGSSVTTAITFLVFDLNTFGQVTITSNATTNNLIDTFTLSSADVDNINKGYSSATTVLGYPQLTGFVLQGLNPYIRWVYGFPGGHRKINNGLWIWMYGNTGATTYAYGKLKVLYQ